MPYYSFDGEAKTAKGKPRSFRGDCYATSRDDAEWTICAEIDGKGWRASNLCIIEIEHEGRPASLPRGEIVHISWRIG